MPRIFFVCSIFFPFLWHIGLSAQSDEVEFDWLEFHSEFERAGFEAYQKGDSNFYYLLFASSAPVDSNLYSRYGSSLEIVFESLDSARLMKKSPKRIVKEIFTTVHGDLLVKYNEENRFFELFENGYYNCVSATAIYSYMLGRLGIEHALVELPTHVLVVAFIEGEQWVLESTDPQQGYYEFKDEDEDAFIEMLIDQKMITEEELNSEARDSLLQSFSSSESVNAARLVAIQYFNQMIYAIDEGKWVEALQACLKARFIDSESDNPVMDAVLWNWIDKHDYTNPNYFEIVSYAWQRLSPDLKVSRASSIDYYGDRFVQGDISQSIFLQWADFFSTAFNGNDSAQIYVNTQIQLIQGRHAYNQGEVLNTLHFGIKAMNINEHDQNARSLLMYGLGRSAGLGLISDEAVTDSVFKFNERYPSLLDFPLWRNIVADIYISKAINSIEMKNFSGAEKNLNAMEDLLKGELPETIHRERVSRAYSKVAHYFYQRNTKKALEWIERGLHFIPDDVLLNDLKEYYSKN